MAVAFRTAVLTGATSGIGEALAGRLAQITQRLVLHGPQDDAAVADTLARIRKTGSADVRYMAADYAAV